jgi:hypothetical protein
MTALLFGTMRMRFVLHTPSPIKQSNADIVLGQKTAVWNCSPIMFVKNKKPLRMVADF